MDGDYLFMVGETISGMARGEGEGNRSSFKEKA